jgi:hypothetical protein
VIDRGDLRAAVAAGAITEAQAASLTAFADARRGDRAALRPGEEPFELFRGMNEIFIVVGLVILGTGWFGVLLALSTSGGTFRATWIAGLAATLVLLALLAEYFVRRRRMVAPAILLTVGWAAASLGLWLMAFGAVTVFGGVDWDGAVAPLALTTVTTFAFWLRFRVPFAMAVLAATAFGAMIVALAVASGQEVTPETLFRLSGGSVLAWGTLLFGLALFALAMRFDASDRHRVGLRAANGFWLHVAAAPAIVNTVALTLLDRGTAGAHAALAALLVLFALVAIVIDRRSFLLAAVGYVVVLAIVTTEGEAFAPVVLTLGAALVALGAGWQGARRRVLRPLPARMRDALPPSA